MMATKVYAVASLGVMTASASTNAGALGACLAGGLSVALLLVASHEPVRRRILTLFCKGHTHHAEPGTGRTGHR